MKRVFLVISVFMLICTFAAAQAFAAGQQKDTKAGQTGQMEQSDPKAGAAGQQGAQQSRTGQIGASGQEAGQAEQISRVSELMDKKVQNQQGQELGQVEDLILSKDGKISYIIVSRGGVMGIGDKLTPIPFRNAQLDPQQDAVILSNIDKQKMENAPTISQGEWQMLTDPGFERELFSYYGEPSSQGQMQPGAGQPRQMDRQSPPSRPQTPPGQTVR